MAKLNNLPYWFRLISLIDLFKVPLIVIEIFLKFLPLAIRFKPSIVHCSNYLFLPLALIIKALTNAMLIYDAHELESATNQYSKLFNVYIYYLEKISWPFINSATFVSESIKNWYETHFGPKRAEVILNSPVIRRVQEQNDYFRNLYNIPTDIKIFLYLGMLSSGRGINIALDIFKNLNGKQAIIFMGSGEMRSKIVEFSKSHKNIFLHEPVNHADVVQIASSADFGYCMIENESLSYYYSLPNKLFEYIFAGLPVIASDFPEISKIVKKFNVGITTQVHQESITKGVKFLVKNGSNYNFRLKDLTTLGWDYQAEKLVSLLNEMKKD